MIKNVVILPKNGFPHFWIEKCVFVGMGQLKKKKILGFTFLPSFSLNIFLSKHHDRYMIRDIQMYDQACFKWLRITI